MKKLIKRYRINRSWGDGVAEALWWALRGKSFVEMLEIFGDDHNKGDK